MLVNWLITNGVYSSFCDKLKQIKCTALRLDWKPTENRLDSRGDPSRSNGTRGRDMAKFRSPPSPLILALADRYRARGRGSWFQVFYHKSFNLIRLPRTGKYKCITHWRTCPVTPVLLPALVDQVPPPSPPPPGAGHGNDKSGQCDIGFR